MKTRAEPYFMANTPNICHEKATRNIESWLFGFTKDIKAYNTTDSESGVISSSISSTIPSTIPSITSRIIPRIIPCITPSNSY